MKQTVAQLKSEAKALKIPRYSKMRKAELIEAIAAHKEYDPADNSAKSYSVAIASLRNKLTSFRREQIGDCTLYLGDCKEILPLLPRFDACVTDPPYGIGIANNPVRQKHARKDWDNAPPDRRMFDLLRAHSEYQIIWGGNYFGLPPSQCFLIWDKVQPEEFSLAMCEQAWTNIKKPAKLFRRHVVSFEKHHPTQKPLELMKWCLEQLPEPVQRVFDPFMGFGTTGAACASSGLEFTGIEVDPAYFEIACRRIEAAYKQPDFFVPPPAQPATQLAMLAE